MCKKLIYLISFVLVLGLASSASALVVKSGETVTYSRSRIPDGNTVVEAGGTLIFEERVDFDAGDELHVYGTVISGIGAFPDSSGFQDVKAFIYEGGLWDCYEMRNRGGERGGWITIFPGGTLIVRAFYGAGTHKDASTWIDDGSLLPAEYIVFTDLGSGAVEITNGQVIGYAAPPDGATDVHRDVVLGWTEGEYASEINGYKVYLSENFNDVNDGIGGIATSTNSYSPAQRLDFNTTYYWRVDEVNGAPDYTVYPGDVWSFTTEPIAYAIENITATASSFNSAGEGPENTINGSGLDDNNLHSAENRDMWFSSIAGPQPTWIQYEFDKVYKLHQMWVWNHNSLPEPTIGFGVRDATIEYSIDGANWTTLGTTHEFARAPGAPDYAHNTTVDLSGLAAKYVRLTANSNWGGLLNQYGLSEVRFFYIPVNATEPYPDSGAADVDVDVTLGWRAGREAAEHNVYLSTDEQAVMDGTAPVTIVTETSHGPLSLDLGKTYYWKINEVNEAETAAMWQGAIWDFTTREFLVVDDFESYNDLNPEDPESNRIFLTWLDGYEVPTNGSLVGYDVPPFTEQSNAHSGKQAMPFFFSNTVGAAYSEAELTLSPPEDWTKHGLKTLSLWFSGDASNTAAQMYVKVNGSKVVYDGDAADVAKPRWKQWNIDLASLGAGLQTVTKLAIGIDGNGASGKLYVDDIRLYRLAPEPPVEMWFEAEAADSITEPMKIFEDAAASGGEYIAAPLDIADSSDAPPAEGGFATYTFTVQGGVYKIVGRVNEVEGNSFWVRILDGAGQMVPTNTANHASGWVNWGGFDPGWHWEDVCSNDDAGDPTVEFTLVAGTYTLQIAYRETATLLDAFVITDKIR